MNPLYDSDNGEYVGDDAALIGTNVKGVLIESALKTVKWKKKRHTSMKRGEMAMDSRVMHEAIFENLYMMVLQNYGDNAPWAICTDAYGWGSGFNHLTLDKAKRAAISDVLDRVNEINQGN